MPRKPRSGRRPADRHAPVEPPSPDELPADLEAEILDELAWCELDDDHEAEPEPGDFDFERSWDDE